MQDHIDSHCYGASRFLSDYYENSVVCIVRRHESAPPESAVHTKLGVFLGGQFSNSAIFDSNDEFFARRMGEAASYGVRASENHL
jgi:hypothetical protein